MNNVKIICDDRLSILQNKIITLLKYRDVTTLGIKKRFKISKEGNQKPEIDGRTRQHDKKDETTNNGRPTLH